MTPLSEQLAFAQQQHQAQRFAEADRLCRQILQQQPDHAEALHLLGMTLHRAGDLAGAIDCYQTLLELCPDDAQVYNNLGVALRAKGDLAAAAQAYHQALALQPDYPGVYNNLGNLLRQQKQFDEAIGCYRQAIALAPRYPDAIASIGLVLREQGKFDAAIDHYQQVLTRAPNDADTYNNLGNTLQEQEKFDAAIPHYLKALELRPNAPAFYNNLGAALQDLGRSTESIAAYQQALALNSDYPDAYYNLGNALKDLDRFEDCVAAYQKAISLQTDYAEASNNLGLVLYELGRLEESIAAYDQAIDLDPDYADAHLNRSLSLLMAGDLPQGFRDYEYRWQVKGKNFKPPRAFEQPLWDGEDLAGKTILLHAEQGFGDTIQFIRYAPLVAAKNGRVAVECQEALLRLLQTAPAIDQLIPTGAQLPDFDLHLPLLSLPDRLGTTIDTIPAPIPYLAPPSATHLKLDAPSNRLKVGIVWAGSPDHDNDRHRSCPFTHFQQLLGLPDVQFYSLQKGSRAEDLQPTNRVIVLGDELRDFVDTAAAIVQLDLVITVDTSVAHLAGALGRSVWVLLSFAPDWRWLLGQANSPWYPTMRLFRQPKPGDWAGVISQAKAALLNLLGIRADRSGDSGKAIDHYQQAIDLHPQSADLHLNLGNTLRRQENLIGATQHYQQAIRLDPQNRFAYNNLGVTLRQQGDPSGAIGCYQKALAIDPDYPDTHYNLANLLRDQNDLTAAVAHYQRTLSRRPDYVNAWVNLGNALKTQGQLEAAIEAYQRVLAIDPNHASAHNNLAHALLLKGDLRQGFAQNEWRWRVQNYKPPRPKLPQPLWDGKSLEGRTILLYAEQGLGDTIQFIRYAPQVARRGGKVFVECQPALVRLLQTVEGIDRIIPRGEPLPPFEVQAPLLTLPHLFDTTLETVPAPIPYLSAPPLEPIAPSNHLKIGIVWAGSPTNRNDRYRSCALNHFAALFDLPHLTFYSLQKGSRAAEIHAYPQVTDLSPQLQDFADTAGAIEQLDLVITVDTAVAHLAGALGKPVWLLLCTDPDWRWMLERLDSPWYPTLRIFRQARLGDWSDVFAQVKAALRLQANGAGTGESLRIGPSHTVTTAEVKEAIPLGIGWQIGAASGWGIYGTNLALHLLCGDAAPSTFEPLPLLPPADSVPLPPLHQKLLQPMFERAAIVGATIAQNPHVNFPILKGLGNQFITAPILDRLQGTRNFGVIFFEEPDLDAAALERAKRFDRIITGSTWNADVLKSYGLTQVDTVFQGVDPTLFYPAARSGLLNDSAKRRQSQRFVIFSGGKLEYRKGQDIVVRAFREFHDRHPDALLLTAWHNFWANTMRGLDQSGYVQGIPAVVSDRLQLGEWLIANGIPETAFIDLGIVPNALVAQILREADVALFPNRCEGGTNLAAMESLACGVPTILSANTGHLDLLGNHCYALRSQSPVLNRSGWGESDVEEILATLEAVYTDRTAAQQRGLAAARFMQDWSWNRQIDRLVSIVKRCL